MATEAQPETGADTAFDRLLREVARADEPALAPGTLLADQFEIQGELGRGGMGVVHLARDLRLDREVAIKVMHLDRWPEARRPRLREIFLREAKATARLTHPNIVTLHQFGEEGELMYLVLERLRGESLAARLARERPSREEAIRIAVQIVHAVAYAHGTGVLHRDLKPQNVFIGADGRVRVLDFGIAAILGEAGTLEPAAGPLQGPPTTTRTVGTPGYMAPEQIRGEPQDARTDAWALAVCLFELFSGGRPFEVQSLESLRAPARLRERVPSIPAAIDAAVASALVFDPAGRMPKVELLLDALQAAQARPARRTFLAVGAALIAGLTSGIAWFSAHPLSPLDLDLEGTWAYTPGGADKVILRRLGDGRYLFEFTDAEPGTAPSIHNFYIRGELALAEDAGGKLTLSGEVDDAPGWGKGQLGWMAFDVLAEDRLFMTRSDWGGTRGDYHFSYPPWLLVRVHRRPRDLGLTAR